MLEHTLGAGSVVPPTSCCSCPSACAEFAATSVVPNPAELQTLRTWHRRRTTEDRFFLADHDAVGPCGVREAAPVPHARNGGHHVQHCRKACTVAAAHVINKEAISLPHGLGKRARGHTGDR